MTVSNVTNGNKIYDTWGNSVATDVNYLSTAMAAILADWTTWVNPQWLATTTNPTIGNGSKLGNYKQVGKTVDFELVVAFGSTTTVGSGLYTFTAPVPISQQITNARPVGQWKVKDVSANADYGGALHAFGDNIYCAISGSPVTYLSQASPITWATGDLITLTGHYRAA